MTTESLLDLLMPAVDQTKTYGVVVGIENKINTVLLHDGTKCSFDIIIESFRIGRVRRLVKEDDFPLRFARRQIGFQPGLLNFEDIAVFLLLLLLAVQHNKMNGTIVIGINLAFQALRPILRYRPLG